RVRGDGEVHAVGDVHQRAVVADAEHGIGGRPREVAGDEVEFGREGRHALPLFRRGFATRGAATSSARTAAARRSSTPFTYLWPSVPPNVLPSSMASLMVTR